MNIPYVSETESVVRRRVRTAHHGEVVFVVTPEGLYFRERGRKTAYLLPYGVAFQASVDLAAQRRREERLAARGERKRRTRRKLPRA